MGCRFTGKSKLSQILEIVSLIWFRNPLDTEAQHQYFKFIIKSKQAGREKASWLDFRGCAATLPWSHQVSLMTDHWPSTPICTRSRHVWTDTHTHTHSLPESSNASSFAGIAGAKQQNKSITHLGCRGGEASCWLGPFLTTEQRHHRSLWLTLTRSGCVSPPLHTVSCLFLISRKEEEREWFWSSYAALKCACIHAKACVRWTDQATLKNRCTIWYLLTSAKSFMCWCFPVLWEML